MSSRVFTEEEKSQIKLIMLEAGFPLLKKYLSDTFEPDIEKESAIPGEIHWLTRY